MTDIELLPLPEGVDVIFSPDGNGAALDVFTAEQMQDYAHVNVAHATAAKDAEIERLRGVLGRILENEASDYKVAEAFGGYVLDDELREEARAALHGHDKGARGESNET